MIRPKLRELKSLIEEYEELVSELDDMADNWENGDECAAACSDPSDQFMKECEIETKIDEIKSLAKDICSDS